jgi:anti-sigma-K factor RskA
VSILQSDLHLLTGAYALDALEPAERDAFERHLASCGSCEIEIRGLRETAARLAFGVTLPPPPAMQQRVLDAAYQIRQLPPLTAPLPHGQHVRPGFLARLGNLVRPGFLARLGRLVWPGRLAPLRRPRFGIAVVASLAVASLATVVVLGIAQVRATHQLDSARSVAAVLAAPDARTGSRAANGGGTVSVTVSRTQGEAVVTAIDLPPLPSAEVYQLWLMGPAGARSAGLLPSAQHGRTAPLLATGVSDSDRFGITVEPAGGTTRPTTAPLIVMSLPT